MSEIASTWLAAHPLPAPGEDTDKNARGRVLVAGASVTVPGALRLTGEAALRAGAGKLQLATVEQAALPLGIQVPEAAVFPLQAGSEGELAEEVGDALADLADRADTLVLGPGTGAKIPAEAILAALLRKVQVVPLVIDAAMIAAVPKCADLLRARAGAVVLTPHSGEMAQLMDCDAELAKREPERLAREAAQRFGVTVVLKGSETWIACSGDDGLLHYPGGGPGLATGGSGDVLAGILGGLMARGAPAREAAAWAVWLHGEAGRRLARRVGPTGFLGRELLAEIPGLMASV